MEPLILYSLSVYFLFYVLGRSRLTRPAREYLARVLPRWVMYPLECSFCFTFHLGWLMTLVAFLLTGTLQLSILTLCASPILVMMIDLIVKALEWRGSPMTLTYGGTTGISTTGTSITYKGPTTPES